MVYLILSCEVNLNGPTITGDQHAPKEEMELLKAEPSYLKGRTRPVYLSPLTPRECLNVLEEAGYLLVGCSALGQTCTWTVHKPSNASN